MVSRPFSRLLVLFIFGFVAILPDSSRAGERVEVQMSNGDKIEGELLKRADGKIWLMVGGELVSLPGPKVKRLVSRGKDKLGAEAKLVNHGLYSTARLPVRDMQGLVGELGPAIVVVKTPGGLGTGWFVHRDGYLVTNHHVVAGERTIRVTMFPREGKTLGHKVFRKVRIVALNADMDLALLKIEEKLGVDVPQLVLGDSGAVKAGDKVFAIGNPLGLERSTSQGIISKVARNISGRLFIQTTAPIAPGNSGGPLFNQRGEVVGVVSRGAILLDGLGFAIPSSYIKEFLNHIESFSYDEDNPNTGVQYMEVPVRSSDGRIRLGRSDFVKVGHGLSGLVLGDLDGDGVSEIVFANNNKSEIGILRYRPGEARKTRRAQELDVNDLPSSERFALETLPVSSRIGSLAIGDVDGDGRRDLIFYGSLEGLALMRQEKNGRFAKPVKLDELAVSGLPRSIRVVDVDGDGKRDLFVLGMDRFSVFAAGKDRRDHPLHPSLVGKVKSFELLDPDGDGRKDVLFFTQNARFGAYLRRQGSDGRFDEELPLQVPISGPVRSLEAGKQKRFVALDVGKNRVRALSLARNGASENPWTTLPVDSAGKAALELDLLDLNGEGGAEILSIDEKNHEYVLYRYGKDGFSSMRSPSPEAVTRARLYRDDSDRALVFTYSRKEQLFGVNRMGEDGIAFPRPIRTQGPVQLMQLERLKGLDGDGDEKTCLLWVEKLGDGFAVQVADANQASRVLASSREGALAVPARKLRFRSKDRERSALANRPVRLAFADFNGDEILDLIVFWAYSGKESLYIGKGKELYDEVLSDQGIISREGDKAGLLVADLDGNGRDEVLQVQPGFVRVLRVDGAGKLFVASQHNWRHGPLRQLVSMGKGRFVAVDGQQAYVVRLVGRNKRFQVLDRMDLGGLELSRFKVADVDGDGQLDLVGRGNGHLAVRLEKRPRMQVKARTLLNSNLSHHTFFKLHVADLDSDGRDELLLFDSRRAVMEILRAGGKGPYRPVLRHPLYDKHLSKRAKMRGGKGGNQPRAVAAGDVDGNGRVDLVFLLHDRVAIYLQDRVGTRSGRK